MKTSYILLVSALLAAFGVAAQPNSTVPKNIRASNTLDNLFDANGLASHDNLYGIPLEPGDVVGNAYLNTDWKRTAFMLYDADKMIEGYPTRYEIDLDQFEIKTRGGIKVLSGRKVKSFVWADSLTKDPHYFVNGRDFMTESNVPLSGFFEVLTEGTFTLLSRSEVVVKNPTYNEKLDMGNRDIRILKKEKFYYLENEIVKPLSPSKRKFYSVFGDHAGAVEKYVKQNGLFLDQSRHLKAIFEQYNGLTATN